MASYVFLGYPAFLQRAADELGRPESALAAGRVPALASLANLCSQATHADPDQVADILAKAGEFRDQIHTAWLAADLMLSEVKAGCQRPPAPARTLADPPRGAPRSGSGGSKNSRGTA
ncbi:hypothetical protein TA3x_002280 [Tundrisphaera sp. TA3]|uniref:hypothetical protein n=1 Tax=Tundrisphaera sp. TA3 TaxID=3435775 RepID=UPI003EBCEAD7